jgi:hypothetical protein
VNDLLNVETDKQKDSEGNQACRPYFPNKVTEKGLKQKEPHEIVRLFGLR